MTQDVTRTREEIRVPELPEPLSHYCDAVRFGDLLFISGVTALDGDGVLVGPGDAVEQTRQIFSNMEAILRSVDASFGDILRVSVFLTDINDIGPINSVRKEVFGPHRPASTLIEVSRLAIDGMSVEIDAIAGLGSWANGVG